MSRPLRIITGGIHHETNGFTPLPTTYNNFEIVRGLERYTDENVRMTNLHTLDLVPTFVASASPGGLVQREAYEQLKEALLREIAAALPADGLLLDLHGAMEVEGIGDGETDLIDAARELVGDDILIAVSLDLHGNISPELVARADILTAYRTAPHRDELATRQRALHLLAQALRSGQRPVTAMVKLPFVLAGEAAVTDNEPARELYSRLSAIAELPGLLDASLLIGCAWTDSPYATVSTLVVAETDHALALEQATNFAAAVWERREQFGYAVEALDIDTAIARAMSSTSYPVYISDSGDNLTAGAPGDRPQVLARLLAAGATDTLVAGVVDPAAVRACADAGVGATVAVSIGAALDSHSGPPLACNAIVERVDGALEATAVVVRIDSVRVILTSKRQAFTERSAITKLGIDLQAQRIIVVKLGYLFPDLAAHAAGALLALSEGATSLRLDSLPYGKLPRPIFPLDPQSEWPVR